MRNPAALKTLSWLLVLSAVALLMSPNFLDVSKTTDAGRLEHIESMAYGTVFWLLWFAVWKKIWLGLIAAMLPCLWLGASIYLRSVYQTSITSVFVGMFADTTAQEFLSFLSVFGSSFAIIYAGAFTLLASSAVVAYKHDFSWTHSSRRWVLLVFPLLGAVLYFGFNQQEIKDIRPMDDAFRAKAPKFWVEKWSSIYPMELYFALDAYRQEQSAMVALRQRIDAYKFNATQVESSQIENVILVVGESSRADRWSLYGQDRDTTPELKKRKDLFVLKDVITPSIATRESVPIMISREPLLPGEGRINPKAQPSLLRLFEEMGYDTYWFSNQAVSGRFDTPIAFYAKEAKHVRYLNPSQFSAQGSHDDVLLPILADALKKPGKKFIVLHTMGSHFNYDHRYPQKFDVFQPSLRATSGDAQYSVENKQAIKNSYDNSLLYSDHILSQIISMAGAKSSSLVMYSSDHGEDLFDEGCKISTIGRTTQFSYWIPAFVWASESAQKANAPAFDRLRRRSSQPLMTRNYFELISDLSGINLPKDQTNDIGWGAENWVPTQRWIPSGEQRVDFDVAKKTSPCAITLATRHSH